MTVCHVPPVLLLVPLAGVLQRVGYSGGIDEFADHTRLVVEHARDAGVVIDATDPDWDMVEGLSESRHRWWVPQAWVDHLGDMPSGFQP